MDIDAVQQVLSAAYAVPDPRVRRIPAGLATTNFAAESADGRRLFVKVYRPDADLAAETAAIELSRFAEMAGIPTASPAAGPHGQYIHTLAGAGALSVWTFVDGEPGDAGPLDAARMQAIGTMLGRLHRRLATYPHPVAHRRHWCDIAKARTSIDTTVSRLHAATLLDEPLLAWAVEVLSWRRRRLPQVAAVLRTLPPPAAQVVHGDCSAGNIMFHGFDVAAIVDFQPPAVRPLWWEIARIGCAQQSVLGPGSWVHRLGLLLNAYRQEHSTVPLRDLVSVIRAARCFMTASVTPFDDLADPAALLPTSTLAAYAAERHAAVLALWDHTPDHDEQLRHMLA